MASIRDSIKHKNNVQPDVKKLINNHEQRDRDHQKNTRNNKPKSNQYKQEREQPRVRANAPRVGVYNYFKDGIDHINVWARGETPLGRALSMESPTAIKTQYGEFRNIFALWVFLTTVNHPKEIATWDDTELRRWVRARLDIDKEIHLPNTKYVCVKELANLITANKALVDSLILSGDAFFDSYIVHNAHGVFPHQHRDWWVGAINLIRAQLQAGQEVNVDVFLEDPRQPYPVIKADHLPRLGEIIEPAAEPKPKKAKAEKPAKKVITKEMREAQSMADREAKRVAKEKLRQDLFNEDPDWVQYFATFEDRRLAMSQLIVQGKTDVTTTEEHKDLPLYVWVDTNGAVTMVATSIFENTMVPGDTTPTELQDPEDLMTEIRKMLEIPDSIPDETIRLYNFTRPKSDPLPSEKTLVIREDVFSNNGQVTFTDDPIAEIMPLETDTSRTPSVE